jgi:hypothetical protein
LSEEEKKELKEQMAERKGSGKHGAEGAVANEAVV